MEHHIQQILLILLGWVANRMRYVTLLSQHIAWFLIKKTGGEIFPPELVFLITETDDNFITEGGDFFTTEESI